MNSQLQQKSRPAPEPEVLSPLPANTNTSATDDASAFDYNSDRYTFVQLLGKGSQGKVYEAIRKSDQTHVAIKGVTISSIQNWKAYDLFWREVEVLKSLNIEGVAKFYDAFENLDPAAPHAYLVQQYIHG